MKIIILISVSILLNVTSAFSQVSEEWVRRFTSDSIRNESVNDMFVDAQGNVYITGSQRERPFPYSNEIQSLTVKYNSQGVQQWIQNYTAPANNGAFTRAIYVDPAGNVYVTGENAVYSGGANEMLVIKYSPAGTQLWANRFQYVNNFYCGGFDTITDADDNVYVTGEYGNGGNNIFLVKYNSGGTLTGQTLYNNGSEGGRKIGIDGAGKIIVAGYANVQDTTQFICLKYEQNLDPVWVTRWTNPQAFSNSSNSVNDMAIDINSNIIIAGTSNLDFATIKIDPAGVIQWSKLYNSASGWDYCRGIVTDNTGSIYVTGETGISGFPLQSKFCTIKYSPSGDQLWLSEYNGGTVSDGYSANDIAIDNNANLYITGTVYSTADFSTVKYNSSGVLQWAATYNGTGNSNDYGSFAGVDAGGKAYVSGNSIGNGTGTDIAIVKYASASIGIQNISGEIPYGYSLSQNYPNPFNPSTNLEFEIPASKSGSEPEYVSLKIFDILGKEVASLVNGSLSPGKYRYNFNASGLTCGVYFYKLQTHGFAQTKKMILIK